MKKVKYGILAFVMCATFACKNAEKEASKDNSKDNAKEKITTENATEKPKKEVAETPKENEDNQEKSFEERTKELMGGLAENGSYSKETEKKVLNLLQGSWELVTEIDPTGNTEIPERESIFTFDGKGGTRTGVYDPKSPEGKLNFMKVKIKTAILKYKSSDEHTSRAWSGVLYIQHQTEDKQDEALGIAQLDKKRLILEIIGAMGGKQVYQRIK